MAGHVEFHDDVLAALFDIDGPVALDIGKRTARVEQTAIRSVQQPGTGRTYRRRSPSGKVRIHVASAPNRPPATDLGTLAGDIRAGDVHVDAEGLVGTVGVSLDYGDDLELGTRYMEPRPFLRPALRAAAD